MIGGPHLVALPEDQPRVRPNSGFHLRDIDVLSLRVKENFLPQIVLFDHALIGEEMLDRERDISLYIPGPIHGLGSW